MYMAGNWVDSQQDLEAAFLEYNEGLPGSRMTTRTKVIQQL